jgi:2-polyprenyl-3-methyl-5-hydroxy-6-metoxy-1,4-benzoquinol methylase
MHIKELEDIKCKLCNCQKLSLIYENNSRLFYKCSNCLLIFVPENYYIDTKEEKKRYEKHSNDINDIHYLEYLTNIANGILNLPVKSPDILDFGCGPNKVLANIFMRKKIRCFSYDPVYNINEIDNNKKYDILVACEVFEHLRNLPKEINFIKNLIKENGYIWIKTQLYDNVKQFEKWWYINDLTHINFFCQNTFEYIGGLINKKIYLTNKKDVVVLA